MLYPTVHKYEVNQIWTKNNPSEVNVASNVASISGIIIVKPQNFKKIV